MHKRPMIALRGLGGMVDPYIGKYLDHRKNVRILGADTPQEAVSEILRMTNH